MKERIFLTKEQAMECLIIEDGEVHNFIPSSFGLVGANYTLESVEELFDESDSIEIGGEYCRKMNHGIAVVKGKNIYFFESDNEKLEKYERRENENIQ